MKTRREFIKCTAGGVCALVVGSKIPWFLRSEAAAATTSINLTITDAVKEMVTHNAINTAECYFWIYKEANLPPECPGPHIFVTKGDTVEVTFTNQLDEPHSLFIPGMFDSGPISPGATVTRTFVANRAGTHLYYDNLNEPVNRVMGLHGALIVMPLDNRQPGSPKRLVPHDAPSRNVKQLFKHLGRKPWWPGLAWEEGDVATNTPVFRQYIWLLHQASPNLFAAVGSLAPGVGVRKARKFVRTFLKDPFSPTRDNRIPQYFTINGQSGHFSHNNPYINPNHRVGEPAVVRILNAGLWTHSMHLHANHFYLISVNGVSQENVLWLDTFVVNPRDVVEWLLPYHRPPDVPNVRGIGKADTPLTSPGLLGNPHPCWPPIEEINTIIPDGLAAAGSGVELNVQLSPLCYPMHDHSEPSQTSQGGNYKLGMIAGMNFIGDRTTPGSINFPNQPLLHSPGPLGVFAPVLPPPWFL